MESRKLIFVIALAISFTLLVRISEADTQSDINQAKAAVQKSLNVVRNGGSSKKGVVDTCVEVLGDALDNLDDTSASVKARKINDANTKASAALTDVDTCQDESKGSATPQLIAALAAAEKSISKVLADVKI